MAGLFYHDVLTALTAARIPFVIVGGLAVNLQGVPRFTSDLGIAVALEGPGLVQAAAVLRGLGLRGRLPVQDEELAQPDVVRGWVAERNLTALTYADPADPLREVDLVISSPVPFDELERSADRLTAAGLTLCVASIPALVRMKTGTGRAQDDSDVEALGRVEALRGR